MDFWKEMLHHNPLLIQMGALRTWPLLRRELHAIPVYYWVLDLLTPGYGQYITGTTYLMKFDKLDAKRN